MIPSNDPPEIASYRATLIRKSWLLTLVLAVVFVALGLWDWVWGLFIGQMMGLFNFILLCRQTAKIVGMDSSKAKGSLLAGHGLRYVGLAVVAFLVSQKAGIHFVGFAVGLLMIYAALFWNGLAGLNQPNTSASHQ